MFTGQINIEVLYRAVAADNKMTSNLLASQLWSHTASAEWSSPIGISIDRVEQIKRCPASTIPLHITKYVSCLLESSVCRGQDA